MSAHVVPKAKPFPDDGDSEEKTTIESGWEEEASTTVDQGEVADKIRALGSEQSPVTPPRRQQATGVTSTGANQLDEPTVDDQHANSQIAAIVPGSGSESPHLHLGPGLVARLVITAGNDVGQDIEIRPGKSYTIGRAIDNDVVLTDIAVSRKHFDLRFQDGAWVIFDRGSGNGTVVNGNVEDNPFMLAGGDTIEIGNTIFRFDQPNSAGRPINTFDVDMDDEELSTVAGKPLRNEIPEPSPPPRERPKTLPPPTPIRPRSPSTFPAQPQNLAPMAPLAQQLPHGMAPQPASTLPLPQMAGRAPMMTPMAPQQAPTMLQGEPHSAPIPQMMSQSYPSQPAPRPLMAGYPQYADLPPGQNLGPLMISPNGQRQDASTAHVTAMPYGVGAMPQGAPARSAQLSSRTKMILGGVGLAVLAGITTIAIVSSGGSKKPANAATKGSATSAVAQDPFKPEPPKEQPKQAQPQTAPPESPGDQPKQVATVTPITTPKDPPKQDPPKQVVQPKDPPKQETPKQVVTKKEPPKQIVAKHDPPKHDPPQHSEPKHEPTPKHVAVVDTSEAKTKADGLYRQKRFTEAASILASAAKSADESEAKELRHLADLYVKVGRGLNSGEAPAAKATDAFPTLRQTENFDRAAGGAFASEIESALSKVAPKAAAAYLADKNYEQARIAVLDAEKVGVNTSVYKQVLDRAAADMYTQASKEASSDPSSAKDKCQRILNFADPKSPWYQKAAKLKGTL